MKLRKSLACLLILAFVFANLPTGMAMVNAENAGSTGGSASVFARTVTTQSDSEFTSPVYFFQQGYTENVNTNTGFVQNFSVTNNLLVATASEYAYAMFNSGATDWSVASGGQLKFDIKAGWAGDITFRIIQKKNDVQAKVNITVPVTATMTEQTIDLSSVSGLDLTNVWGFGIVSYCGEVTLDNLRLEWTTGGNTGEEPIEDNKTFYYFKDDFNGTVSDTTNNTVVSGTWEVSGFYAVYQMQATTAPEITAADVENATLKFKLKVSSGIGGEIRVYLGNAVNAEGSVKNYLSEYSITFDKSNTDWQEISVPLKDFPTTAAYSTWKQYADDTRELDITKLDVFGITCRTYGGDDKVYFDEVRLEWTTGGTTEEETKTISIYNNGTFGISGWTSGASTYNEADENADAETNSIPWKITSSWGNARYEFTSANDFSEAGQRNGVLKFNIKSTGWTAIRLFNQGYKADTGAKDGLVWATTAAGISSTSDQWKEVSIALSDFGQTSTSTTWGSTVTASDLDLSAVKGIGFNFDGTIYVDNVRIEWTQSAESTAPVKNVKLNGGVLSLDGKIGVKMYLDIPEDVSREAIVNITAPDGTVSSVTVDDGTVTEYGIMFYCPVAAKEMTVDIKIQVVDGADASDELKYSVKKYADGLLAGDYSEESKALIKAMLNYGAMAQKLFDYKTDSLANADLAASDQELSATADTLAPYAKGKQSVEGVATLAGTILSLESETTLKLFFGDVAEGATFTYDGATITPTQSGSYYMVAITNIAAKDLNKDYTVTINGKDFTFSAMSFCANVLNGNYTGDKADELVDVAKALYAYSAAADVYFGE